MVLQRNIPGIRRLYVWGLIMSIKAQYNPSTGLMAYNPDTGLVQAAAIGFDCSECVVVPDFLDVTFTDVIIGDGCGTWTGGPNDIKYTGVPDINTTFRLPSVSACTWTLIEPISSTRDIYSSSNGSCSGLLGSLTSTLMVIRANRTPAGVIVDVTFNLIEMFDSIATTPTSKCVEISGLANTLIDPWVTPGWGGTASVVEVI